MQTKLAVALLALVACGHPQSPADESSTAQNTTPTTSTTTTQADARAVRSTTSEPAPHETLHAAQGTVSTASNATETSAPPPAAPNAPTAHDPGVADQTPAATDTKINDRDRHGTVTSGDQKNGKSDIDITAAIRRGLVGDSSLSFTAKNVKVVTQNGKVTLRGPVKSDAERSAVEAKAKSVAGVTEVDNQLEVKK